MEEVEEEGVLFQNMGLDPRILKSIFAQGWTRPTLIQEKAILLAMDGKDVLMKGRTGCGKSAAFLIPILNNLLEMKSREQLQAVRAMVLAPSKELCKQLYNHANALNSCSSKYITVVDVSESKHVKPLVLEKPDLVIGTPSGLLKLLKEGHLTELKTTLSMLVLDEADLMFSFGYKDDITEIVEKILPEEGCQSFLVSATLNPELKGLKSMVLHNPVVIKLEEPDLPESDRLTQYHIQCEEEDKFVLLIALFKLKLIRGRTIIFVNSVDRCYKLKLFLEQFEVRSCVLNSELPITSRCSVVDQFNRAMYDIIIASDELCAQNPIETKKRKLKRNPDSEYSVSRGIDFQNVSNVINFDFPTSTVSYIHRVGRTARGHVAAEGTALSFISLKEQKHFDAVKEALDAGSNFKPYQFRMEELEAFRYRTRDAARAVTSIAIKEARIKEIKREMLTSEKLKSYFKEHPKDLKVLRHDKALHTVKHQQHLKHVPEYIIPPTLQGVVKTDSYSGAADIVDTDAELFTRPAKKSRRNHKKHKQDPWKSFALRRR